MRVFCAKVEEDSNGRIFTTRSRSVGLLGIGESVHDARSKVLDAFRFVSGPYHARSDIGLEGELLEGIQRVTIGAGHQRSN